MKNLKFLSLQLVFAAVLMSFSSSAQNITFTNLMHDFGRIPQGTPVTCVFEFTNTGKTPLILTDVKPSCGCTSPEWPEAPIMPGAKAKIKAEYNAAADGNFNKTLIVHHNGGEPITLTLKGVVYKVSTTEEEEGTELKL